jgi:hypothetical protein
MIIYDNFKNLRKIIYKKYRSTVSKTTVIAFLINRRKYRWFPLVREVLLRYTKIKNVLEYRYSYC